MKRVEDFDGQFFSHYVQDIICTGPEDKITALKDLLCQTYESITISSFGYKGNYPAILIETSNWELYQSLVHGDRFKDPEIEMFSNEGTGNYGMGQFYCSLFGRDTTEKYEYYEHSSGTFEKSMIDTVFLLLINDIQTNQLVIKLKDGQILSFEPRKNPVKALEGMKKYSPVLKTIAESCFGYGDGKKDAFVKKTMKQIGDISNINSIECISNTKTRDFSKEGINAIPDASLCNFISSYEHHEQKVIYDFSENKAVDVEKAVVFFPDINNTGAITEIVLNETNSENTVSLSSEDTQFTFGKKLKKASCDKCLYNAQVIEVPEKTNNGIEVIAIGSNCFDKSTSVKKILLPLSVTWFGENAFTKCKKLETIAYSTAPDENIEIFNINKDILRSMCSLTSEYIVPEEIHNIDFCAFGGCPKLETLILHSNVELVLGAFVGCKALNTVKVPRIMKYSHLNGFLISAMKEAGIKRLVIEDEEIDIISEYMYDCFNISGKTISFDYRKAVREIRKAKGKTVDTALYFLTSHFTDMKEHVSELVDTAAQYAIGSGDSEGLAKLLNVDADYKRDYVMLIDMAKRLNQTECSLILLNKSGISGSKKVQTIVKEEEILSVAPNRLYIKVRFEDNKTYSYFCRYTVKPGDRVYVGGKKAGQPGEVVEILNSYPSGRAAMYTLEVEKAYKLSVKTIDDSQDFGNLLEDL